MTTTPPIRKKLIEVGMPLPGIDEPCARLKQKAPKGYPTRLHKWWAQTPVSAARAVLFAQLVDDPSAWPDRFPTEEDQARERERLFTIMVGNFDPKTERWGNGITDWATPGVPRALEAARYEIAKCLAWTRGDTPPSTPNAVIDYLQAFGPTIYDPFCGSGTIPLEAQRLGLKSIGSDLNPVAVLVSKTLVEIPPKFAGMPPINPDARKKLKATGEWQGKGAQGLSEDVRFYGKWIHDEAEKRIGHLYPKIEVNDEAIGQQPGLAPLKGRSLQVIAWLWARSVMSPNPAAKGAHVPLISSYILGKRNDKFVWIEAITDPLADTGIRLEVRSGLLSKAKEASLKNGTKGAGDTFNCLLTNAPITYAYIDDEANAGRMRSRLIAVIADGPTGRVHLPASIEIERIAQSHEPSWVPDAPARGTFGSNAQGRIYGFKTFADYFTKRQLVAMQTFCDLLIDLRGKVKSAAEKADSESKLTQAYADAVTLALSMALSRHLQYGSTQATWYTKDQAVKGLPQQGLQMTWDYCEANPFGASSANFERCAGIAADCIASAPALGQSTILHRQAQSLGDLARGSVLISTDPPYYDNVVYSDLADFFYVWLRRVLRDVEPELTGTIATPKKEELVANKYREQDGRDQETVWLEGMRTALSGVYSSSGVEPTTIYYAYKQQDRKQLGTGQISTGWATFLQAIHDAGFMVDGTWPMRVNNPSRKVAQGTNALASAVILVCRKRPSNAAVTTLAAFLTALKRELPAALTLLQAGNIAPVDLAQASIGPGMGIFTRHSKVLESDDSVMGVKTALQLINEALDDFLSEQEAEYDAETRYAITWFDTHGLGQAAYGEAETLAKARNVSVRGVEEAGLIESQAGKVRLLPRTEMPPDWDPLTDTRLTVWECAQHLIRRLESDGEASAATLLSKLGMRADATRDLAYRLYGICDRKKWADEARAYNGLVVAWPELVKLAAQASSCGVEEPAQRTLI